MKCCFSQYSIAGKQGFAHLLSKLYSPCMMMIVAIPKGYQKTRIRYGFHFLEKPLRTDRPAEAEIAPARRRNGRSSIVRAFSN